MVIYNGVPLTFFQDDSFQLLNGDFAKILEIALGRQAIRSKHDFEKIGRREINVEKVSFHNFCFAQVRRSNQT